MQLAGERVTLGRQPVPPTTRAAEIEVVLSPYGTFTVVSFELDVVVLPKSYCIKTHQIVTNHYLERQSDDYCQETSG